MTVEMARPMRVAAEQGSRAARRVAGRWPGRIRRRVDLDGLASDLEIRIEKGRRLEGSAAWHRSSVRREPVQAPLFGESRPDPIEQKDTVELGKGLQATRRRFALAHEIGHAILDREFGRRSTELPADLQERFANAFASELLLAAVDARVRDEFRAAVSPQQMLSLAGSIGAPPRVLLLRAKRQNWMADLNAVWLDLVTGQNRYTGRDRRPRVLFAVFDKNRWFLPDNRSVRGLLGDDRWLVTGLRDSQTTGSIDISRLTGKPSRFVHSAVPAEVTAFRVREPGSDMGVEILARVELRPEC